LNSLKAPYGSRRKCEDFARLDIRQIKSRRRLLVGTECSWSWSMGDLTVASIHIAVGSRGVALSYRTGGHDVSQRVEFAWTACHFGGLRTWLVCPACGRRYAVLYGVNNFGRFSCRKCMHLAYDCEAETVPDRLTRKLLKSESKLGEGGERPKGMWRRTYERIDAEISDVDGARFDALIGALGTNSAAAGSSGEAR
jgi:hypothetical protein